VYVKTVLTFATNADAAEVLTNNVYTDDICKSADTVREAQRLRKDIDSVLKYSVSKVGFLTRI